MKRGLWVTLGEFWDFFRFDYYLQPSVDSGRWRSTAEGGQFLGLLMNHQPMFILQRGRGKRKEKEKENFCKIIFLGLFISFLKRPHFGGSTS